MQLVHLSQADIDFKCIIETSHVLVLKSGSKFRFVLRNRILFNVYHIESKCTMQKIYLYKYDGQGMKPEVLC